MTLIRAVLTYRSPETRHMRNLMNAIFNAVSEHSIYIANPDTNLIIHSSDVPRSMRVLGPMTCQKVDRALLYQIQKDIIGDNQSYNQSVHGMSQFDRHV